MGWLIEPWKSAARHTGSRCSPCYGQKCRAKRSHSFAPAEDLAMGQVVGFAAHRMLAGPLPASGQLRGICHLRKPAVTPPRLIAQAAATPSASTAGCSP